MEDKKIMMKELIEKIEKCEFECVAGRLENCLSWIKLKEILMNND